jgi:hypothetical protein
MTVTFDPAFTAVFPAPGTVVVHPATKRNAKQTITGTKRRTMIFSLMESI